MKTTTDQPDVPLRFEEQPDQPEIWWRETVRMFCTNKAAVCGFAGLIIIILVGLFGPVFFEADPFAIVGLPLTEPGEISLLGTDYLGRDVFTGIIYGVRTTLAIAATATAFTVFIGITIGALAGFYGGKVDMLILRLIEIWICIPSFFLIITVMAFLEPSIVNIMVVIGLTGWPSIAASASMPPTPQPSTPRPLIMVVWESVPTSVSG